MRREANPLIAVLLVAAAAVAAAGQAAGGAAEVAVTLTPPVVEAGAPELIAIHAPAEAKVTGEWQGHRLQWFPGRAADAWFALAGVDVESATGQSTLRIAVREGGRSREIALSVPIHPAHYRTAAIAVEPKFVEPGPEARMEIEAEQRLKAKVFAASADAALWSGSFAAPVNAAATDSFGTRRTFNGKLASVHKGTDFRAATGTVVRAGNSGRVLLAQPLYYEGNCVMIDHGLGLISISMHLSRIDVKPGERVARGERIGLSGATGRVTGPHLHWAIRWQDTYLDPAKLLRLNLDAAR